MKVAKRLYLDLVEGPTRSITCCERPTRVLTLASNGLTLMEPSAGAGGNVARQVVDVDVDGCQRRIVPRAPIDWWILKVGRKNPRRSGYPSPTPGSHWALHQVVLATFRPSKRPTTPRWPPAARFWSAIGWLAESESPIAVASSCW